MLFNYQERPPWWLCRRAPDANGATHNHPAHQGERVPDPEKAAHSCKEGFIDEDPSPAVLKTEFPPELEHVIEHPPRTVCTFFPLL